MEQTTPTLTPVTENVQSAAGAFAGSRHLTPELAWQIALDRYSAAKGAETAYDDEVWTPAHTVSQKAGISIPDEVEEQIQRLQGLRIEAEDGLLDTAAPTISAVLLKIETARQRWEGSAIPDSCFDIITADLRRIEGEG